MKKIVGLFLIALFSASLAFAATPGFRVSPGIGENKTHAQGGQQDDPGKTFRIVRYMPASSGVTSATLESGSIVIWDTASNDGVTVTTTTVSPASTVAGIIVQAALTPDNLTAVGLTAAQTRGNRNWTWLQTHGLSEVRINATNAVSSGDAMGTSATAGEADIFVASASDSAKNGNAGFFFDASAAAADDVECFIMCE